MPSINDILAAAEKDGAGTAQGKKNDFAGCCDSPLHIVIGLFFDGTGNNQKVDAELRLKDEAWSNNLNTEQEDLQGRREAEQAAAQREADAQARLKTAQQERALLHQRATTLYQELFDADEQARRAADKKIGGLPSEYDAATRELARLQEKKIAARSAYEAARAELSAKDAEIAGLKAELEAAKRERERLARERHVKEQSKALASPVTNGPSNIAKLHDLYPENESKFLFRSYIKGVGTFNGAESPKEYTSLGQGFGLGKQGGSARIEEARKEVLENLRKAQGCKPDSVTFDIFGFSRGAALARHFVNVILAGLPDFSQDKTRIDYEIKGEKIKPTGYPLGNLLHEQGTAKNETTGEDEEATFLYQALDPGIVKIRFLGIFDTVGSFYIPGTASNGPFRLTLPEGCAEKVAHLVSRDERRKNFRGSSIFEVSQPTEGTAEANGWKETCLGGVHSDIGGGYPLLERTYHLMDKSAPFMDFGPNAGRKEKEALLERARKAGGIVREDGTLDDKYCLIMEGPISTSPNITRYQWLLMRVKYTRDAYANYCLRRMWEEVPEEVKLSPILAVDNVPPDLEGLLANTDSEAERQLWEHYFHVSAIDNEPIIDGGKPIEHHSRQPLGYYLDDFFLKIGMRLDENPRGPRVMFPNSKPQQ